MKLLSLNIRHGGGKRFEKIKSYLSSQDFDVLLLQEFRDNKTGQFIKEYLHSIGYQFVYNKTEKSQNTVLTAAKVITKFNTPYQINDWSCLITEINSTKIINVYFPQRSDKKIVFDFLKSFVIGHKNTVIAGDFNTGNNVLDTEGTKFHCSDDFNELSNKILNDAYRLLYQTKRDYSWYSNKGNGFRVDHILVSDDLKDKVISIKYDQSTRKDTTDHAAMSANILVNDTVSVLIKMLKNDEHNFESHLVDYTSGIDAFDWMSWNKGLKFYNNKLNQTLYDFDQLELKKLLLMVLRKDRFDEGFLVKQKNNGNLLSILEELQRR